ncbi:MAG: hypothetical protein QW481_05505 [Candidatus Methanomethylicia archaeon]
MLKQFYLYHNIAVYVIVSIIFLNITFLNFHTIVLSQRDVYDLLQIDVIADGSIHVGVYCYFVELPFSIPYIPSSITPNYLDLEFILGKGVNCFIRLDLNAMSESEADVYAYKIIGIVEDWLRVKFNMTMRVPGQLNAPQIGLIRWMDYIFDTHGDLNYDVILDEFFSFKPRDGWMQIIEKKAMSQGDRIFLEVYSGSRYGKLIIRKYFRNYFNFKVGNTYILDLFELFNITVPIKFNGNSRVIITLLSYTKPLEFFLMEYVYLYPELYSQLTIYSNFRAEIVSINIPFEYSVGIRGSSITIENIKDGKYTLRAGDTVDYMKIAFQIVEYGFKLLDLGFINIFGIILALICVSSTVFIIYKLRFRKSY